MIKKKETIPEQWERIKREAVVSGEDPYVVLLRVASHNLPRPIVDKPASKKHLHLHR